MLLERTPDDLGPEDHRADLTVVDSSGVDVAAEPTPEEGPSVVLGLLGEAGAAGLTWREFDSRSGWDHHGRSSGALSSMHKRGLISRLTERRDKCSVYVLNEHVGDRETAVQGAMSPSRVPAGKLAVLEKRNDALFTALDNLAHAAGFSGHRHVWVEDAETCFLCQARALVATERVARTSA